MSMLPRLQIRQAAFQKPAAWCCQQAVCVPVGVCCTPAGWLAAAAPAQSAGPCCRKCLAHLNPGHLPYLEAH